MKEYRKLKAKMKKAGFELIRERGHSVFSKNGINVTVGRGVKNSDKQLERSISDWKKAKHG